MRGPRILSAMADALALVARSGIRYRVASEGLVIGRGARCELVIDEPAISRVQAIVYPDEDAVILVVVGSAETLVNGKPATASQSVAAGDAIMIGTHEYRVAVEPGPSSAAAAWMLRDRDGQLYGVSRGAMVLGGGERASVRVPGWPERVATLHPGERLSVEAHHELELGGVVIGGGEIAIAEIGQELVHGDRGFRVIAGGASQTAATPPRRTPPERAVLELLPRGGRLVVGWGEREHAVYLPERRCELVALLLQPPPPYRAGELVPDEVVLARLGCERVQLNVLVHRARRDLVAAGLDGVSLIERARGGVATRFAIEADARVAVL